MDVDSDSVVVSDLDSITADAIDVVEDVEDVEDAEDVAVNKEKLTNYN